MRLRALAACLPALASLAIGCAAAAAAAPSPAPDARAWLVENPVTGEVLASHAARERMPIASITKLMTVLVALDHLRLRDIVTVDPRAAAVGQESIALAAGEELTVGDLVKGALIQSANDAADALALATVPSFESFADLMNAKARRLGLSDSHFVRPDGLDAPDEYSSARDVTRLAEAAMRRPVVRNTVDQVSGEIEGGRTLHTWNDLLGVVPGVFGVKTGHTDGAGWSQVAAVRRDGATVYVTILGSPSRTQRNADLSALLAYGLAQYRLVDAITGGRRYVDVELPYGRDPLPLVAPCIARHRRAARPHRSRSGSSRLPRSPCRCAGASRSDASRSGTARGWSARGRSSPPDSVDRPGIAGRAGWYARRTVHNVVGLLPMIVTVTLNAAMATARSPCRTSSAASATARARPSRSPAGRESTSPAR